MQASCPVAVTAVGEHEKLIEVSCGGILLSPKKSESWLDALLAFIRDIDQQRQCAANGQAHVKSHYTLENTYHEYESLYQRLLD
jgi:glycosyltransferase involved in cell wall biosynthesis